VPQILTRKEKRNDRLSGVASARKRTMLASELQTSLRVCYCYLAYSRARRSMAGLAG
jgi:hypothetical protein